mmetsp:Transcript_32487/g.93555  ORF Transcript_32487/g.93555 Transcript_32487/m.93555 type:complete len:303 (+) Transcript_32487:76-984(+)
MVVRRKRKAIDVAAEVAPADPEAPGKGPAESSAAEGAAALGGASKGPEGEGRPAKKKRRVAPAGTSAPAAATAVEVEAEVAVPPAAAETEEVDRRGIVHLASVPAFMSADKVRHLMEEFGEIGRVYLAPEDKAESSRRKRAGGNRKMRFTEGWVEFMDRRLAKRVAGTLNATAIGGKKRHNFYRDDMWNLKYLPRFKWHMLKEGTIYNRHVRKARLEQKLGQARRENDLFLERVHQAKTRKAIEEKRAAKGSGGGGGGAAAQGGGEGARIPRFPQTSHREMSRAAPKVSGDSADRILSSLFS